MNLSIAPTSLDPRSTPLTRLAPPTPTSAFANATQERDNADRELFSTIISRAQRTGVASREAEAKEAARGLVSAALVQPILKQLRESPNAAPPPFGPGPGERSFREMMDATVAQKLVTSQNWPLVDRLARDLLRKSGGGVDPTPATPASPDTTKPTTDLAA